MATVKRITDLSDYTSVLPYASEMFGVYQPLLGWKSTRIAQRFVAGYANDKSSLIERLKTRFAAIVEVRYGDNSVTIAIRPGVLSGGKIRTFDSVVLDRLAGHLPVFEQLTTAVWASTITPDLVNTILEKDVVEFYTSAYADISKSGDGFAAGGRTSSSALDRRNAQIAAFEHSVRFESSVAGAINYLVQQKSYAVLERIFYVTKDSIDEAQGLLRQASAASGIDAFLGIDNLDPRDKDQLECVALSPIGVVHLFRQYFFELDTFLGTPVSHVWLSPGSTVELIETHTRQSIIEKTLETTLETLTKSETTTTQQDEISEAVKEDTRNDVKFGASIQASYASIQATSSFDYGHSQQTAREVTHKQMRQQTEKLSSEIRKNFKSTFRTVTEQTDFSSAKHTMANTTNELLNYELRRKMRQVGVQVQDIGTFLCWQSYVDDPGRELGIAKLVHIAKPAELESIPHPEEIPLLQPFQEEPLVTIPFISADGTDADNEGVVYVNGAAAEYWGLDHEEIQTDFPQQLVCQKANYQLTNVEFDPQGKPFLLSRRGVLPSDGTFTLHLDSADFQGQNSVQVKLVLQWSPKPGANDDIVARNGDALASFKEAEKVAYEKAFVETVKDRVTLASKIQPRSADGLREEERISVYRKLIQDMLLNGVDLPDDRTRHVTAELLNAIFDVDKMLYFVAPEWWRPRMHRSRQQLQPTATPTVDYTSAAGSVAGAVMRNGLMKRVHTSDANVSAVNPMSASTVGWGGADDAARDNYFITEASDPAKFGSSLGWLLQLDGDNMRNAFLNAPWVKAVMPIRPGMETAAINWLEAVEGMNGITDDVVYHASNPDEKDVDGNPLGGQKMIDVLKDLAEKIRRKYKEGVETGKYPKQDEVSDPALVDEENTVTATPSDRVYEHGFFPLEGSFRANVGKNYEIFDQWIEILPTDQIVPVEVKYDPKTGRQV
ncbi:hypothetical protein [Pseudarthrobacter sp. TAF60_1]|uniref:hypothetical protein n=1 Tax=Pseudarthrobacter sp. TAF60_1 TaxID=3233071 RepID=UPI003F97E1DF